MHSGGTRCQGLLMTAVRVQKKEKGYKQLHTFGLRDWKDANCHSKVLKTISDIHIISKQEFQTWYAVNRIKNVHLKNS